MLLKLKKSVLQNKKSIILFIVTVLISVLLLTLGNRIAYDKETMFMGGYDDGASKATVTEIVEIDRDKVFIDGEFIGENVEIIFSCKITSGENKGETVTCLESISVYDAAPLREVNKGDKILITATPDGDYEWYLHDFDRSLPLWILGGLFVLLVLLLGRRKGVNTVISLSFTIAAVFLVFVPSVLSGGNIYFWSIAVCVYIITMSLAINEGYNKKMLAAVVGCVSGVVISGVLAVITSHFLHLTGITSEETIYIKMDFDIDLNALIFAGIILGAVGAVKDVAVSISSSLKEIHDQIEKPTFKGLVKSGMNIGRDIMGTMADTLVLAYIGCELSATLLQVVYSSSMATLFSREKIVAELLQALVGSIGILLAIPLTAVVSAALYTGTAKLRRHKKSKSPEKDKYYIEPAEEPDLFQKSQDK